MRGASYIFALLALTSALIGAEAGGCERFRFEPRQQISIRELRELAAEPELGPGRSSFVVWWFDSEDHPVEQGWEAVALIEAATGDLGETPVAGILWTSRSYEFAGAFRMDRPDKPAPGTDETLIASSTRKENGCPVASLVIERRGLDVFVDGRQVGTIKD